MFRSFLSADMTYSCAIFPELDKDLREGREIGAANGGIGLKRIGEAVGGVEVSGDEKASTDGSEVRDELEEAQLAKLR